MNGTGDNRFTINGGSLAQTLTIKNGHITLTGGSTKSISADGNNYWSLASTTVTGTLTGTGAINDFTLSGGSVTAGINATGSIRNHFEISGGNIGKISGNDSIIASGASNKFNFKSSSASNVTGNIKTSGTNLSEFFIAGGTFGGNIESESALSNVLDIYGGTNGAKINGNAITAGSSNATSNNKIRITDLSTASRLEAGGQDALVDLLNTNLTGSTTRVDLTASKSNQIRAYDSSVNGTTTIAGGTTADNKYDFSKLTQTGAFSSTGKSNAVLVQNGSIFSDTFDLTAAEGNILHVKGTAAVGSIFNGDITASGLTNDFNIEYGTFAAINATATGDDTTGINQFKIVDGTFGGTITATGQAANRFEVDNATFTGTTNNIDVVGGTTAANQFKLVNGTYNNITTEGKTNVMLLGSTTGDRKFQGAIKATAATSNHIEVVDGTFSDATTAVAAKGNENKILIHNGSFRGDVSMEGTGADSTNVISVEAGSFDETISAIGSENTVVVADATITSINTQGNAASGNNATNIIDISKSTVKTTGVVNANSTTATGDSKIYIRASTFETNTLIAAGGTTSFIDIDRENPELWTGSGSTFGTLFQMSLTASDANIVRIAAGTIGRDSDIYANNGGVNEFHITGSTSIDSSSDGIKTSATTKSSLINLVAMTDAAIGYNTHGKLESTDKNTLYIGHSANYNTDAYTAITGGANAINTVVIDPRAYTKSDANDPNTYGEFNVKGVIDLTGVQTKGGQLDSDTRGKTNVFITHGTIKRDDPLDPNSASIIGASGNNVANIWVSGGRTTHIDTNSGTGNYVFTGGMYTTITDTANESQVYIIHDSTRGKEELNLTSTAGYYGGKEIDIDEKRDNYMHYQLLNLGKVYISYDEGRTESDLQGAKVTIGAIGGPPAPRPSPSNPYDNHYVPIDLDSDDYAAEYHDDNQAQISADHVIVQNTSLSPQLLSNPNIRMQDLIRDIMNDPQLSDWRYQSKLMIHENYDHYGKTSFEIDTSTSHNIINKLEIGWGGAVTLDRTSIHGKDPTDGSTIDSVVTVNTGGTLYGFGVNSADDDHSPKRANVFGSVTIMGGGRLQPYDRTIFTDVNNKNNFYGAYEDDVPGSLLYQPGSAAYDEREAARDWLKGVQFKVDGDLVFKQSSILSTRLFHKNDGTNTVWASDGEHKKYFSDSVTATGLVDFKDMWKLEMEPNHVDVKDLTNRDKMYLKLQYDPVFGFNYELRSKQEFQIYQGNPGDDTQTYYYSVAYADQNKYIEQLFENQNPDSGNGKLLADANHIANRYILKSDMLGEWFFMPNADNEKTLNENENGTELLLRFRLLVPHPTMGGIKSVMQGYSHRNEVTPGQYLDELRYPFQGIKGSDIEGSLNIDPSSDMTYREEGYNGNMVYFFEQATDIKNKDKGTWDEYNPIYDNYRKEWIEDFETLFHAIQLNGVSGSFFHEMVRTLHGETYANMTETTLGIMQSFIQLRERNSMSALYQVENDEWDRPKKRPYGMMYDPILDAGANDRFVQNPIRFWGSAFGQQGRKRQKNHDEFGYESAVWGGAVGMIKETGDMYHGLTIGYAYNQNKYLNYNHTSSTTNSHIAEALVGFRLFEWGFAELHGNYSYNKNKNNRVVYLPDENDLFTYSGVGLGDFKSHVTGGGVRFGWQQVLGENWLLVPTIGFNVMDYRAEAFTEGGRDDMATRLVFEKGAMDRTVYRIPLQLRLTRSIAFGGSVISPEIRAGYTPVFGDRESRVTSTWVGYPIKDRKFHSYGLNLGTYEAWLGGTIEWSRRGRFYVAGNYDYSFGSNSFNHNFSLQAGLNF